jgi:tetratricopeptide (TPR) repeat protein
MKHLENLRSVIETLVYKDVDINTARKLLDSYQEKISSVEEHLLLANLCNIASYSELQLKCIAFAYTRCLNDEKLYGYRNDLSSLYYFLNFQEEALFYNKINFKENPSDFDVQINQCRILSALGRLEESDKLLKKIEASNSEQKFVLNREIGKYQLRNGDLEIGLKNLTVSYRNLYKDFVKHEYWDGIPKPGKTIIINGHGGIGDEFLYFRFFQKLKSLGMNVIFYSGWEDDRSDVNEIFRNNGVEVVTSTSLLDKDSLWVNMMALPGYMTAHYSSSKKSLWEEAYIKPSRKDKNNLNDTNFKIAIKTQGNPHYGLDHHRTLPINDIVEAISDVKNVSIYCFDEEWVQKKLTPRNQEKVNNAWIKNWGDTIDLLDQMDLVISSCSGLVHAAGSMGKNVALFAPMNSHFTWLSNRKNDTTSWYGDNFKLFKQTKVGDWKEPIEKLKSTLVE